MSEKEEAMNEQIAVVFSKAPEAWAHLVNEQIRYATYGACFGFVLLIMSYFSSKQCIKNVRALDNYPNTDSKLFVIIVLGFCTLFAGLFGAFFVIEGVGTWIAPNVATAKAIFGNAK